ncbi:MAG: hypothetical protein DHS20C21_19240 [Gemmatimonadota bacterium]|nr:MAG: hypothetical protein DHS20C21_19240 [Gemmatimonadota bacterium]
MAEKEAYFSAHPEVKDEKGSGWKPFNRHKWFVEQRMYEGELPAAGARWEAWQERMNRVETTLRRSGEPEPVWFSLGPANLAGRMLSIAFHPSDANIVYAGSAGGGLWKSTDNGTSWAAMTDHLPSLAVGGVAVSPNDPDIVVIATGEGTFNIDRIGGVGILRSTDAGVTWATTSLSYAESSGHGFHFVEANPITGTLLAGATDGLYRSTDDGATWTQEVNGGSFFDAKWKPGDANKVYSVRGSCNCSGANVKVSTDDGDTWSAVGGGTPSGSNVGKSKLAVTAADPDYVYVVYGNTSSNLLGVWRTTDDGASWSQRATSPNIQGGQGWYNLSLTADPNDAERIISGGVSLYKSTDGGATFSGTGGGAVHVDHHLAAYEPGNPDAVWVGSDGGLWRSAADGDGTWVGRNSGLVTYQFYDICVNKNASTPYYVFGGTQDNGTDKWSGTTTWSQGLGGDGMVCVINEPSGATVFAETQFGNHYKSRDFGTGPWTSIQGGITGSGQWVTPVAGDANAGGHLYTETSSGIFRTLTGGGWTLVASHRATWIDISRLDGDVVWTTRSSGTFLTTDDGGTWTQAAPFGFSTGNPTKIHADPADVDGAFVTFSSYASVAHVARTTDRGASWTDVSGNLPNVPVNAIVVDPESTDDWYIGTDVGVWKSDDGGANWLPWGDGSLPNTVIDDLEISHPNRKLVAGTHGRGAWELDIPLAATDVAVNVGEGPARNLMLDRPFPNPTADRVMLRFAARQDGPVSLSIYDVRGRMISRLAEFSTGDGVIRTTPWFPDDSPSGVYFAVLNAGAERISRKIVVAR